MKHYKVISIIAIVLFIVGCRETTTYQEVDYTMPVLKVQPRLMYPKLAQENDYKGTSKIYLTIAEDGTVEDVQLLESSGYAVLDDAALDYCKKLIFKPAEKEGKPIKCRMAQRITFDFLKADYAVTNYINQLHDLFDAEKDASIERKKEIRSQILNRHNKFVEEMGDALNFNDVLKEVLLEDTYSDWVNFWDRWPLSFLLYHDFIQRYPDYDSLDIVINKLQSALEADLFFIMNTKTSDVNSEDNKMSLVTKIKRFIEENYPSISVENFQVKKPNTYLSVH